MVQRALIVLVAVLSASAPLTRGYCELTCLTASSNGQASTAGHQHSCHDDSQSGAAIGPGAPVCGHGGEMPVGSGNLAPGRLLSDTADQAIAVAPAIVTIDATRADALQKPLLWPPDRGRPLPDILRI